MKKSEIIECNGVSYKNCPRGRELSRIAKEHNIQKYLYTSAKARARQRGETFTIDIGV